jgi:hypothetical protein
VGRGIVKRNLSLVMLVAVAAGSVRGEEPWVELSGKDFGAWRESVGTWLYTDEVTLKAENKRQLVARAGSGPILVNGPTGRTRNLVTKAVYRDVEFQCEFLLSERSNSGVKFIGHYEIQLFDSFGKKAEDLTGSDCGGVYPRGESLPSYHTIDKGTPPRVNACKKPGEWQTLHIIFQAPRFGADGVKTSNARFVKVVMNGQVIHENVELKYPTGSAWRKSREVAEGSILLQGDHGPVAFRNVRVRPWLETNGKK